MTSKSIGVSSGVHHHFGESAGVCGSSVMSINHTEHFEFQNDSPESLKLMLQAICPILFGQGDTTEYKQLWLRTHNGPTHWNDGSEYRENGKLILHHENRYVLVRPSGWVNGARMGDGEEFTTLSCCQRSLMKIVAKRLVQQGCGWLPSDIISQRRGQMTSPGR